MTEAFIFDAIRTPRGKGRSSGALHGVKPIALLAGLMQAMQKRNDLDTAQVDDIVVGCVTPVDDQGSDIARVASAYAGWDFDTPGVQLDRFCGSGLESVNLAAAKVRSGWEELVVAGGVESMSRCTMLSNGGAWANDPDTVIRIGYAPQGVCADAIATMQGFSREDVDSFAVRSNQLAAAAIEAGHFRKSIVPVVDDNGFVILDHDELVRPDTTLQTLAGLKNVFAPQGELGFADMLRRSYPDLGPIDHVHTAGNSSGVVDGAALLLVGNERIGKQLGLKPRARIVAAAAVGTDPSIMLTGAMPAARKALAKAGMNIDQIDLFEVNEAFAAIVLTFAKELNVPMEKINVNGGAIAMGHPLGATGSMLIGTALEELERRNLRFALCTACIGAGQGVATIIERL